MSSELLPLIRQVMSTAGQSGLDGDGQVRRAVAEVLRLSPHLAPADALRVVEIARAL